MSNDRRIGLMAAGAVALVFLLGWVSTAEARNFAMSGKWVQRRGIAYIPQAPGPAGIPATASAVVQAKGGAPATITVPPNAFQGTFGLVFPLPQPSLIQISTAFQDAGPKSAGQFRPGFWAGNRPFPNFAFCPGATANPACIDHRSVGEGAAPGQGTNHGLVRYTQGPKGFGGTMQMVSGGGGALSIVIQTTPNLLVLHNPFGGATGAAPTEAPGGAYANVSLVDVLPGGPITLSPGLSGGGLITAPGPQVGTGAATTIINIGFSWTTGQVYVRGTNAGPVTSTTVTLTGSDSRTPLGAGNITLVAGGIGNRVGPSGYTFVDFDRVEMTLTPLFQTPAMSPTALAAGGALLLLAFGYFARRRFA